MTSLFAFLLAASSLAVSAESSFSLTFPSPSSSKKVSPLDSGSLFIPKALAGLYPDFGGPHLINETFFNVNECRYGFDRVMLELGATAEGMLDETAVGFSLSVNDYSVAEGTSTKTSPSISMEDVIYPPMKDSMLEVTLEVVFFDGKINSNVVPSGILPSTNEATLTFQCAPPFALKGIPYKKKYSGSLVPDKKLTLGKLPQKGFKYCECQGNPQYLPTKQRPGPLYPKQKLYISCKDQKRIFLPIPNEPFKDISDRFKTLFSMYGYKFKVNKIQEENMESLYQEICGGRGLNSTIRMTGCDCEKVPTGYSQTDLAFDFDVQCPMSDEVDSATQLMLPFAYGAESLP